MGRPLTKLQNWKANMWGQPMIYTNTKRPEERITLHKMFRIWFFNFLHGFSFSVALQPKSGPGCLIVEVSRSITHSLTHSLTHSHIHTHTHTHTHTPGRTPPNEWWARYRGRYLPNTQETNNNVLSGIRTRNPSRKVASDLRLRSHGHRDRKLNTFEQILFHI